LRLEGSKQNRLKQNWLWPFLHVRFPTPPLLFSVPPVGLFNYYSRGAVFRMAITLEEVQCIDRNIQKLVHRTGEATLGIVWERRQIAGR
jgi:hypothetical protein